MKKLYISLLLAMIAFIAPAWVNAQESVTVDGIVYSVDLTTQTASVTSYNYQELTAPSTILSEVQLGGETYPVTSIGRRGLYGYPFTTITIPGSIKEIGKHAFTNAHLTSLVLPEGVTTLDDCAFSENKSLASLTLPSTLTSMGFACFACCYYITDLVIPEGITTLSAYCFHSFYYLKTLELPSTLTTINQRCFDGCEVLESVTCHAVTPPAFVRGWWGDGFKVEEEYGPLTNYAWQEVPVNDVWLYVPAESEEQYKQADQWKDFKFLGTGIGDVRGAEPCGAVQVFDTMGRLVATGQADAINLTTPGLYIVKGATSTSKVLVR